MSADSQDHPPEQMPTLSGALIFRVKATLFQLRRHAQNVFVYRHARHPRGTALADAGIVAESTTPLWTDGGMGERGLQAGKVHNLRVAVRRLDGVEVDAGAVFSFWTHVGRVSHRKGYVRGREVREGCIIPNIGGGLCQLSNALYDAALRADFEIVERHAHTRVVPGSLAEVGRDATVFWNYVDLRWRSAQRFRIEATLSRDHLTVRFRAAAAQSTPPREESAHRATTPAMRETRAATTFTHITSTSRSLTYPPSAATLAMHSLATPTRVLASDTPATQMSATGDCFSCGVHECFRHVEDKSKEPDASFGRAAFLVDEFWPEFDDYMQAERSAGDVLFLPLDGRKYGKANYAWEARGFNEVRAWRLATMLRSLATRRLASQGAARQQTLLRHAAKLADAYAAALTYDVAHITVMQHLLPHLWLGGHLGGRTFDVLMNSLPLAQLHESLNLAAALHPESSTLADFRADERLVQAEREALAQARRIITPHAHIASLFGARAMLLNWRLPHADDTRTTMKRGSRVVFPAATIGRKGAYEVREAARRLGFKLTVVGAHIEGENFWNGVKVERRAGADWLADACVVVLPAFVEHRPRRLLEAIARGVPVIASDACGLGEMSCATRVAAGDVPALCAEIERALLVGAAESGSADA